MTAANSLRMGSSRISLPLDGGRGAGLQGSEFRQPPVYGRLALVLQIVVDLRKMPAAEKSAMRRQRRRMRAFEHQVFARVDKGPLLLRIAPPKHKHQTFALAVERIDDDVRKLLPALVLMAAGSTGFHGERRIEQEH